jgi:pimeloyl-ACP methyl ester carboxylesterase
VIHADLVVHGASDAPSQKYTVAQFPDDLAWLCGELHVERAVLVGHSMGGVVALELAGRYPQVAPVCLIDSVVFRSEAFLAQLGQLGEQLATTNYTEVLQRAAASLFIEKDDPERKTRLLAKMAKTPQHVAVAAFRATSLITISAARRRRPEFQPPTSLQPTLCRILINSDAFAHNLRRARLWDRAIFLNWKYPNR